MPRNFAISSKQNLTRQPRPLPHMMGYVTSSAFMEKYQLLEFYLFYIYILFFMRI